MVGFRNAGRAGVLPIEAAEAFFRQKQSARMLRAQFKKLYAGF